jgi:hypothetical protein
MANLADATSQDDLVIKWATQGIKAAEKSGQPGLVAQLQLYLAADMVRKDEYGAAVRMSFAAVARTMAGGFSMRAGGKSMLAPDLDVEAVLGPRSGELWREVELVVLRSLILPAVFRIADVRLDDTALGVKLAERLARECHEVGRTSADHDLWQMTADVIEASFGVCRSPYVLERMVNNDTVDQNVRVIARVGVSIQDGRSCVEALGDQLATVSYALGLSNRFAFRQIVTPFVTHYWLHMVEQQPFRFSPPALAREEILSASREPVQRRAKAVLRAAMVGLGVRGVPPHVHAWLRSP